LTASGWLEIRAGGTFVLQTFGERNQRKFFFVQEAVVRQPIISLDQNRTEQKMADTWDDGSDDDWDVNDEDLDARLGLNTTNTTAASSTNKHQQQVPQFDDEEDLAVIEKAKQEKLQTAELKKKGQALLEKKAAEMARKTEEELARKIMELEAAAEANMTPEQRKELERRRVEDADHAVTEELFGGGAAAAAGTGNTTTTSTTTANSSGTTLVLKDMKDHLKHAMVVGNALREHGKILWALAFFREAIQQSADVLDDAAVTELIKILNVLKNEKVQAAKRKTKGAPQKSKKNDKAAAAQARKIQTETFGDSDKYDKYDEMGGEFEDAFF
jgi:translation initiation factor 3 subunit J